jgi:quinol monooxygenase YgiN
MDFFATDPFTRDLEASVFRCQHEPVRIPPRPAFCVNVRLCIQPEVREEFLQVIRNNQKGSRQESLCLQYDFGESLEEPNVFYFHEQYTGAEGGKEGFDAHAATLHFAAWEAFASKENVFTKPPAISFFRTLEAEEL